MPSISYRYEVPFGHRLMFHKGKCKFPHGHNYVFEVTVFDDLDEQGMVRDFSQLKESVKSFFEQFDHAFVLHEDDPFVQVLSGKLVTGTGVILLPDISAKVVVLNAHPTAENLCILVVNTLRNKYPEILVECWEQESCSAMAGSRDAEEGVRGRTRIVTSWIRDLEAVNENR